MSGHHFDKHIASLFTQDTSLIRKLTIYDVKKIKSSEKGVSGHHFDKHTASLFTQDTSLIRKLTIYDVKKIKSSEKGVSGHHFDKQTASLFAKNKSLIENLHPMLFKQSSQQRDECQVIILISIHHHYSLKTHY